MNEKGGVWNYLEKPGWDFQASSRVPLAGRATAPIASYTTGDVVPWKARPRNATARRNATGLTGVRRVPRSGRRRRPRDSNTTGDVVPWKAPRNRRRRDDFQERVG